MTHASVEAHWCRWMITNKDTICICSSGNIMKLLNLLARIHNNEVCITQFLLIIVKNRTALAFNTCVMFTINECNWCVPMYLVLEGEKPWNGMFTWKISTSSMQSQWGVIITLLPMIIPLCMVMIYVRALPTVCLEFCHFFMVLIIYLGNTNNCTY